MQILIRQVMDLYGIVQGVGFRPALYQLAVEAKLSGWVQNRSDCVRLAVAGEESAVTAFLSGFPERLPKLARLDRIEQVSREVLSVAPDGRFRILESWAGNESVVSIPADLAICPDCAREVLDPADRRYGYAFTTCTRCGPRYTVVQAMPYDRERTTLAAFPLCPRCRNEYEDPENRRFHAESIACPDCGPQLLFRHFNRGGQAVTETAAPPLTLARRALAAGSVLAVRGIGGYLLAVNALDRAALTRLRERKRRPHKPFAVMARNLAVLRRVAQVPDEAARLLTSPQAPIVILDLLPTADRVLPGDLLTPDARTMGAMLPTSPLHLLLFQPLEGDPTPPLDLLVMTSGNRRGEPICLGNDEAEERLAGIADDLLEHDREITLRNDDSLCVLQKGRMQVWRRGRGFAPDFIGISPSLHRCVLAMGAELKNTIALGQGGRVVLSPHIGDLDTPEALDALTLVTRRFPEFLEWTPEVVAVDLHPDMHATRLGRKLAAAQGYRVVAVQHHHAHAAAALAEHGLREALALVFDGTGLGTDGKIWGAELLHVRLDGMRRYGTFRPAALPGGDAAVRQVARQVAARWFEAGLEPAQIQRRLPQCSADELAVWALQMQRGVNCPLSHAAGRVFDAFSVALGAAPERTTFDGQSAIRLEALARTGNAAATAGLLPFAIRETEEMVEIDWRPAFVRLYEGADSASVTRADLAAGVHQAMAEAAETMLAYALDHVTVRDIVLTGGVFMNRILTGLLVESLTARGLTVWIHRLIPPNDGGISLGQAVIAGRQ